MMMMSSNGGARSYMTSSPSPFTATQFQELEHQALIFKYMVSGVPIPPDLIYSIKRSLDSTRLSFPHQPIGWGCFQMGFGRKIDPEPGRCRRTDGKKWRCSKEAYPDSKYCERHMHRGRNRSRKPVENHNNSSKTPSLTNTNTFFINSPPTNTTNTKNLFFNSGSSSHTRYVHGIDEQALFPEASGSVRSLPAANDSTMNHYKAGFVGQSQFQELSHYPKKHHHHHQEQEDQEQHCFVLGTDFKSGIMRPIKLEKEINHENQKPLHHFLGSGVLQRTLILGLILHQILDYILMVEVSNNW